MAPLKRTKSGPFISGTFKGKRKPPNLSTSALKPEDANVGSGTRIY